MTKPDRSGGQPSPSELHSPPRYADLILAALNAHPGRAAFHWSDGSRRQKQTYGQTAEQILRLSSVLSGLGLDHTAGISLLTGPRPEAFTFMAASCHAGIRFSALHPMATRHDDDYVLRDSGCAVLLVDDTDARFDERAQSAASAVTVVPLTEFVASAQRSQPSTEPAKQATYLFYTGGTTGEPKGVILRDRSLTANAWASATWPWPPDTRFLISTPMSHAAGLLVAPGLMRDAEFCIQERFEPARVREAIESDGVNATFMVPTMLYALLDHLRAENKDLQGLKWLLYGAAPTIPARIIEARERLGPVLTQHYGQAEAPNALTMLAQDAHLTDDQAILASCGRPMPGVQLALLNEVGDPVPTGSPGELCVRGPLVMDGYWNKPEQTAAALADGWLHTGDLAVRDSSGNISIVDRLKDLIITGGFNVYPREVENALNAHPAVATCAVYGEPDDRWGESVVAAVVLKADHDTSAEELTSHVRSVKGSVWAPKRIDFYERLPVTALGKMDKQHMRRRHPRN